MAKIKRIKNFQQVVVLKCKKCQKWQGQATSRTQEQLNDGGEQKRFKLKIRQCIFCHKSGQTIDLFHIKGICSNREAIQIIQTENRKIAINKEDFSLEFN